MFGVSDCFWRLSCASLAVFISTRLHFKPGTTGSLDPNMQRARALAHFIQRKPEPGTENHSWTAEN